MKVEVIIAWALLLIAVFGLVFLLLILIAAATEIQAVRNQRKRDRLRWD